MIGAVSNRHLAVISRFYSKIANRQPLTANNIFKEKNNEEVGFDW
jgi:hypothetical protein